MNQSGRGAVEVANASARYSEILGGEGKGQVINVHLGEGAIPAATGKKP